MLSEDVERGWKGKYEIGKRTHLYTPWIRYLIGDRIMIFLADKTRQNGYCVYEPYSKPLVNSKLKHQIFRQLLRSAPSQIAHSTHLVTRYVASVHHFSSDSDIDNCQAHVSAKVSLLNSLYNSRNSLTCSYRISQISHETCYR